MLLYIHIQTHIVYQQNCQTFPFYYMALTIQYNKSFFFQKYILFQGQKIHRFNTMNQYIHSLISEINKTLLIKKVCLWKKFRSLLSVTPQHCHDVPASAPAPEFISRFSDTNIAADISCDW